MDDQDKQDASTYVAQGGNEEAARAASILLRIYQEARAAGYHFPGDDTTEEKQGSASTNDSGEQQGSNIPEDHPDLAQLLTKTDLDLYNRLSTMHVSSEKAKIASGMLEKLEVYGKVVENLKRRVVKDYRDLGIIVDGDLMRPPYARVCSVCLFKKVDDQDSREGFRLAARFVEDKFYGFMTQREKKLAETSRIGIHLNAYCTNNKLYEGIKLAKVSVDVFVLSSDAWAEFWEDNDIKAKSHGISIWFSRVERKKMSLYLAPARVTRRRGSKGIQL
ncbi:hypothetical protein DCAR_0518442 [Daucus carota subsp. sativus]|uniref:Uncharacterized protein n=1 Tax=Daucus carota subsp. sativus TaxID=79200 RepID=A0A164X926_DAUCS|nr:hypothetical protein DCAR_0518442 [Daucus carota subsp. sativus]